VRRFRDDTSALGVDQDEISANRFAAELLMPEEFLARDVDELSDDLEWAITYLAQRYRVSEQAMTIRLMKLGKINPPE
ncbi:MAG: ImmA/IrrE family metallo-endopeptidase, partial [Bacillota bacterium]